MPKLIYRLNLLIFGISIIGCGTSPVKQNLSEKNCLNEAYVESTLVKASEIINSAKSKDIHSASSAPKLVESTCKKRIYHLSGYRILVSEKPASSDEVNATFRPLDQWVSADVATKCLRDSEANVQKMNFETGIRALKAYKERFPDYYNDPDIGPVKWLQCQSHDSYEYWDSLPVLAHELSHELREKDCIFPAIGNAPICFELGATLPKRSLGKLSDFPSMNPRAREMMNAVQRIYLTDLDLPPTWLFDELNAYTVTALGLKAKLMAGSKSKFYNARGERTSVVLPMFMVIILNYFIRLHEMDEKLFRENFIIHKSNRASVERLLTNAETAFREWDNLRQKSGVKAIDFEENLWLQYLKLKNTYDALLGKT